MPFDSRTKLTASPPCSGHQQNPSISSSSVSSGSLSGHPLVRSRLIALSDLHSRCDDHSSQQFNHRLRIRIRLHLHTYPVLNHSAIVWFLYLHMLTTLLRPDRRFVLLTLTHQHSHYTYKITEVPERSHLRLDIHANSHYRVHHRTILRRGATPSLHSFPFIHTRVQQVDYPSL